MRYCLECVMCKFDMAARGCETCGDGGPELTCLMGHWDYYHGEDKQDAQRYMLMAQTCPDFAPEKWAEPAEAPK